MSTAPSSNAGHVPSDEQSTPRPIDDDELATVHFEQASAKLKVFLMSSKQKLSLTFHSFVFQLPQASLSLAAAKQDSSQRSELTSNVTTALSSVPPLETQPIQILDSNPPLSGSEVVTADKQTGDITAKDNTTSAMIQPHSSKPDGEKPKAAQQKATSSSQMIQPSSPNSTRDQLKTPSSSAPFRIVATTAETPLTSPLVPTTSAIEGFDSPIVLEDEEAGDEDVNRGSAETLKILRRNTEPPNILQGDRAITIHPTEEPRSATHGVESESTMPLSLAGYYPINEGEITKEAVNKKIVLVWTSRSTLGGHKRCTYYEWLPAIVRGFVS